MVAHASHTSEGNATFDGAYEILSAVGRGRNSVVYRARKLNPRSAREEIVALKVLLGNAKQRSSNHKRMRREALAMLACRHPNVIRLNDYVSTKDLSYLSMEYADGGDLRALLESRSTPLSVEKSIDVCIQILLGVDAIHRAGVLHRDLKPENVLLCGNQGIKIADFGVAVLPISDLNENDSALGVGTFDYLAPETLRDGIADVRSDLYSIGVTLFQLVTQHLPFEGASISGQIDQKMHGLVNPVEKFLPDAPEYLSPLLRKALANNPADRFQSAAEFQTALQRCLSGNWKVEEFARTAFSAQAASISIPKSNPVIDENLLLPLNEDHDAEADEHSVPLDSRIKKGGLRRPDLSPSLFAKMFAGLFVAFAVFAGVRWIFSDSAQQESKYELRRETPTVEESRTPEVPSPELVAKNESSALPAEIQESKRVAPSLETPQEEARPVEQRAMLSPELGAVIRLLGSERIGVIEHLFADGSDVSVVTTPTGNNKFLFALGLIGWRPVEIDLATLDQNRTLEIQGSGINLVLHINEPKDGEAHVLTGTYNERISGREGSWRIW